MPTAPSLLAAALVFVLASSCRTPVGVDRIGRREVYAELVGNVLTSGELSIATRQILERHDLLTKMDAEPDAALADLHRIACAELTREYLCALSEAEFYRAEPKHLRAHYLASAVYAWLCLYDSSFSGSFGPYDPRFRVVGDLYNAALTEFLRDSNGDAAITDGSYDLPFGRADVHALFTTFRRNPDTPDRFVPAADFELRGLRVRNYRSGMGVALISAPPLPKRLFAQGAKGPPRVQVANALLRITDCHRSGERWDVAANLEVSNSQLTQETEIAGTKVPLESDLSAAIAYALQRSKVWDIEVSGFFSGQLENFKPGLVLLAPHTSGKIPVILVHGTASSPARWAELLNGLSVDPTLASRYEVWLFTYTTGNAVQYSTWLLRKAIDDVLHDVDPDGKDAALHQMVVIGHSQGGILARLLVSDSGDVFWNRVIEHGLDPERLSPETRAQLRDITVWSHSPYVKRVVFLSTPHHGSFAAGAWYSRLIATFISLPADLLSLGKNMITLGADGDSEIAKLIPTSVGQLGNGTEFIQSLQSIPIAPEVATHSIIPVKGDGPIEEGDDGIVEYKSAHLPGAESEFVVRSDHSCQSNPLTIVEVRRILLEHLKKSDAATAPAGTDAPKR